MRPHTLTVPKSMLEVAGRPFVDWQLERLAECGHSTTSSCASRSWPSRSSPRRRRRALRPARACSRTRGPTLLGTAGAIRAALELLAPTFLVTYGDSYLPFDYAEPLRDPRRHADCDGVMAVFENARRLGRVERADRRARGCSATRKGSPDPAVRPHRLRRDRAPARGHRRARRRDRRAGSTRSSATRAAEALAGRAWPVRGSSKSARPKGWPTLDQRLGQTDANESSLHDRLPRPGALLPRRRRHRPPQLLARARRLPRRRGHRQVRLRLRRRRFHEQHPPRVLARPRSSTRSTRSSTASSARRSEMTGIEQRARAAQPRRRAGQHGPRARRARFTVALLNALHAFKREFVPTEQLAERGVQARDRRSSRSRSASRTSTSPPTAASPRSRSTPTARSTSSACRCARRSSTSSSRTSSSSTRASSARRRRCSRSRRRRSRENKDDAVQRMHRIKELGYDTKRILLAGARSTPTASCSTSTGRTSASSRPT